ncbi:MAG: hypothetical protein K2H46_00360 [Muribaculaceae bacterium]|nr:hypothetical protein [Muribaculaceae bacterium]
MKIEYSKFSGWTLLLLIMVMMQSCSGCSHRSRRIRERHRERVEQRVADEDKVERSGSRRARSQRNSSSFGNLSEEQITSIAEGEDYDAMLDCQFHKLNEIKQLKDEYFRGDMSDKKAEERMNEIEEKFAPIDKALNEAQSEGLLTYNQHKRQLKLMGDYLKVVKAVATRLGSDISSYMDL